MSYDEDHARAINEVQALKEELQTVACQAERYRQALTVALWFLEEGKQAGDMERSMMHGIRTEKPSHALAEVQSEAVRAFIMEMDSEGPWQHRDDAVAFAQRLLHGH